MGWIGAERLAELEAAQQKLGALEPVVMAMEAIGLTPQEFSTYGRLAIGIHEEVVDRQEGPTWAGDIMTGALERVREDRVAEELRNGAEAFAHSYDLELRDSLAPETEDICAEAERRFREGDEGREIAEDARGRLHSEIEEGVKAKLRAEAEIDVAGDALAIEAEVRADLAEEGFADDAQNIARAAHKTKIRPGIEAELLAEAGVLTPDRTAEIEAEVRKQLADDREFQWILNNTRQKAVDAIHSETKAYLVAEITGDQATAVREEAAAIALKELAIENRTKALTDKLSREGLPLDEAEDGDTLTLILGDLVPGKVERKENDYRGYEQTVMVDAILIDHPRTIKFVSRGGNHWIVERDSLADSASRFEQNDKLPAGTVVSLGRLLETDDGTEFDPRLRLNTELFVQPPKKEPTDTLLRLQRVTYNGTTVSNPDITPQEPKK